uniref:Uncharacterized protein n=1 Tax=Avena sativa TaxID=4498 RepID=A0ACD5WKE8_AVESA
MEEHAYDHHSSMSPSTPAAAQHKGSSRHHTTATTAPSRTTTTRPAIRIIHIVAPEIIKTDTANFRGLVQRLTGRQHQQPPAVVEDDGSKAMTVYVAPTPTPPSPVEEKPQKKRLPAALANDFVVQQENMRRKKIKCEVVKVEEGGFGFGAGGGGDLDLGELWVDLNPEGFLSFLEEDVFQVQGDFAQHPLGSSRRDFIGEMCASFLA